MTGHNSKNKTIFSYLHKFLLLFPHKRKEIKGLDLVSHIGFEIMNDMSEELISVYITDVLRDEAKKTRKKVLVTEGWDENCLYASQSILNHDIVDLILLDNGKVRENAKSLGLDISKAEIVNINDYKGVDELVSGLVELRKHKGMDVETAKELLKDPNYFASMYAYNGHADAVVGSRIYPTKDFIRPALQVLKKEGAFVSDIRTMYSYKNRDIYFLTDVALNKNRTAEDLSKIAENAVNAVKSFGFEPVPAFLSFSTYGSGGSGEKIAYVRKAKELAEKAFPDVKFYGEIQMDAAINPASAKKKCSPKTFKGNANILIFPDINSGNIAYHSLMNFANIELISGTVSGLKKPVSILGRSASIINIENSIYSVAAQANNEIYRK